MSGKRTTQTVSLFLRGPFLRLVTLAVLVLPTFAFAAEHGRFRREQIGIAVPYLPEEIDPLQARDPLVKLFFANIGVGLTKLNKEGVATLDLAEEVSQSEDGLTWTIRLPHDRWLSSERRLGAAAIKDSFDWLIKRSQEDVEEGEQNIRLRDALANISEIKIEEKPREFSREAILEKIIFHLQKRDGDFAEVILTLPLFDVQLMKRFGKEVFTGSNLSSAGPYQVMEENPAEEIVLVDRENYVASAGAPQQDLPRAPNLSFRKYSDAEEALSALRVGAVDIVPLPTEKIIEAAQQDSTLEVIKSPLETYTKSTGGWLLGRSHWSNSQDPKDALVTSLAVVRRSLQLDTDARVRFNLSQTKSP